jgi:hypothetical protein
MKNLLFLSSLLLSFFSFSQTNQKGNGSDKEKEINVSLDSLSKVYHVNVVNYSKICINGIKTTSIGYYKNGVLIDKIIKTDTLNIPSQK